MTKRYRPLGLSIAILATAVVYGVWPILPMLFLAVVSSGGHDLTASIMSPMIWVNVILAAITLLVSVIAWIGRPPQGRWLLLIVVWVATVFHIIQLVQVPSVSPTTGPEIGGSLSGFGQSVAFCQIPLLILVPLYISWYINRTPARAFYQPQPLDSGDGTQ
jgi:hypothetical protein